MSEKQMSMESPFREGKGPTDETEEEEEEEPSASQKKKVVFKRVYRDRCQTRSA